MKKSKYKLSFYKDKKGKPIEFTLPKWNMLKQEQVWAETAKYEKEFKDNEDALNRKYRKILILKGLEGIVPVTEDDINGLHPDEVAALYLAIYLQGKESILVEEEKPFRSKNIKKESTA